MKNYLSIEQPDQEITIDFLPFNPETDIEIKGATVKINLVYNPITHKAFLHIYAIDAADCKIIINEEKEIITEYKKK